MAVASLTCNILSILWPSRKRRQKDNLQSIDLDPLAVTATTLQTWMSKNIITAVKITTICLQQIDRYDDYLRAVIHTNQHALERAAALDRCPKRKRGPLHGIPIIVKDNIETGPKIGLPTTAGSFALLNSQAYRAAPIIERLIDAGVIIIGKAQLSEFAFYKGSDLPAGWSAIRGQAQSPYTDGDVVSDGPLGQSSPGGSSTGSATAVAMGYAPIAIGTDTTGSVIIPATRNALYGLRITPGLVSSEGIVPLSRVFDTVGIMAKSPADVWNVLDALTCPRSSTESVKITKRPWSRLRVGVVAPEKWKFEEPLAKPHHQAEDQIIRATKDAYVTISGRAAFFKEVELPNPDEIVDEYGLGLFDLFRFDFEGDINGYLKGLKSSDVRTLKDIIKFNNTHANKELPRGYDKQDLLENAVGVNVTKEKRDALLSQIQKKCREEGIEKALRENEIDVILGPADSAFNLLVCGGGYPSATMPLSCLDHNGRPFGVFAIAGRNREDLLLQVMEAWEQTFQARRMPNLSRI